MVGKRIIVFFSIIPAYPPYKLQNLRGKPKMNHKLQYFLTLISTTLLGNQVIHAETPPETPTHPSNDSFLGKLGTSPQVIPEIIEFSHTNYTVDENGKNARITVTRTHCGSGSPPVSVSYTTNDGTAQAGSDYKAVSGRLVWGARAEGDCYPKKFIVPVKEDAVLEGNETVTLNLNTPFGEATVSENAVLTILDNDIVGNDGSMIGFSQTDFSVNEAESFATITVERTNCNHSTPLPASIWYHSTGASGDSTGTAIVRRDYVGTNGILSWGTNPTDNCGGQSFQIPIIDNNLVENDKTVNLRLSTVKGARLEQNQAVLTIMENDASSGPGAIRFSRTHYRINEDSQAATITVNRTECGLGSPAVSVSYATQNGTATTNHYQTVTGTLSWEANDNGDCTPKTFSIPVTDNAVSERNKTVQLQLSNPTGGAIITQNEAVLTIVDNDYVPTTPIAPDNPGIFSFSKPNYQVSENSSSAFLVINRTACGFKSPPVSLTITMTDGTASAERDYTPINGTLNWGMTNEGNFNGDCEPWYLYVPMKNDTLFEASETVYINISDPTTVPICEPEPTSNDFSQPPFLGNDRFVASTSVPSQEPTDCTPTKAELEQSEAVLTIIDNDGSTIGFSANHYEVEENGKQATITVNRSGIGCDGKPYPLSAATISYTTSSQQPSTAASGTDYIVTGGTLRWGDTASGESCGERQFQVRILDDPTLESNETIILNLGKARGASNSQSQALLTIIDDETSP